MLKNLTKNLVLHKGIYLKIKNLDLSKPLVEEGGPYVCAWSDYVAIVKTKEIEPQKGKNLFHFTSVLS
ncbi:hypothetical protein [uncultured Lactobacillus sp.]|uniref:hypothetical protein n=1 Tax=uncultured Lactobacillus sp. TaxID=153152 RepID=UPI0026103487|nr:hypothetical protein [uncultured Lactobacillus sp.]